MKKNRENAAYCQEQILRLQGTRFFSSLPPIALKELRDALLAVAEGPDQARSIVTKWLTGHSDYPTPADIYDIGRQLKQEAILKAVLPDACSLCRESPGYIRVTQILPDGIYKGEERTAMAPCQCPRGHAIAAAFAQQKAEEEPVSGLKRAATTGKVEALGTTPREMPLVFPKRRKEA